MIDRPGLEARILKAAGAPVERGRDAAEMRRLLRYHLDEYALQSGPARGGLLGRPGLLRGRVLDVGCGLGQLLLTAGQDGTAELLAGLDLDRDMLRAGAHLARMAPPPQRSPALLAGDALRLPFRDGAFDLVTCRVVLMSLPVPVALCELGRVVRPGGHLYLHLTGWGFYLDELFRGRLAGPLFALANGALLHACGRQVRLRRLWNNFETPTRVARLLAREGFEVEATAEGPRRHGAPLNHKLLARRRDPGIR